MRKILFTVITLLLAYSYSFAQDTTAVVSTPVQQDSTTVEELILTPRDSALFEYLDTYRLQLREPRYKLYPTKNMWTFIKLDTVTGQLWQVHYSVDDSPRQELVLDKSEKIYYLLDEVICGRFTLYETQNMYNFILLDTIDGRCWQVQWSFKEANRGSVRIY